MVEHARDVCIDERRLWDECLANHKNQKEVCDKLEMNTINCGVVALLKEKFKAF